MSQSHNHSVSIVVCLEALVASSDRIEDLLRSISSRLEEIGPGLGPCEEANPLRESEGFKTWDMVALSGSMLKINGRHLSLSPHETVVMRVLMEHALAGDPDFLPMEGLIEAIEKSNASKWLNPRSETVHQVICAIRKKLKESRDLLETAQSKGNGFRISTPARQILLRNPDAETKEKGYDELSRPKD